MKRNSDRNLKLFWIAPVYVILRSEATKNLFPTDKQLALCRMCLWCIRLFYGSVFGAAQKDQFCRISIKKLQDSYRNLFSTVI